MAGHARILSLEVGQSRPLRRQVRAAINGRSQSRSHIPQRQMLLMAELQSSCRTLEDISPLPLIVLHRMQAVVASHTGRGFRQVVVSSQSAGERAVVAILTTQTLQREMPAMGESWFVLRTLGLMGKKGG